MTESHDRGSPGLTARPFDFQLRTRIVFGDGALTRLGELARELFFTRTLIVADRGIVATGQVDRARSLLEAASIAALKSTIARQQKGMDVLTTQFREQASQIQRVSAQLAAASPSRGGLEANKFARRTAGPIRRGGPAPQVVNNP